MPYLVRVQQHDCQPVRCTVVHAHPLQHRPGHCHRLGHIVVLEVLIRMVEGVLRMDEYWWVESMISKLPHSGCGLWIDLPL